MSVEDATVEAVDAARDAGLIGATDAGAVAVLLHVAREIDSLVDGVNAAGKLDNVSVPTYLKYAGELGLTPLSRRKLLEVSGGAGRGKQADGGAGSGLSRLRAIGTGKTG